jgi:hypothetical protein
MVDVFLLCRPGVVGDIDEPHHNPTNEVHVPDQDDVLTSGCPSGIV